MARLATVIILLIFSTFHVLGQVIDTLYLNKQMESSKKKRYRYYAITKESDNQIAVAIYKRSGELHVIGITENANLQNPSGVLYFYKNSYISMLEVHKPLLYPDKLYPYKEYLKIINNQNDSLKLEIHFYKNSSIERIGFVSGCCGAYGTWLYFREDGSLEALANWDSGKLSGEIRNYFSNGQLSMNGLYYNGEKYGFWEYFNDDGSLYDTKNFRRKKKKR